MNDRERARLDRLIINNDKLRKRNEEIRKEVEFARQALKEIQERQRQKAIRMKTQEQLSDLGVIVIPKTDSN